MAPRPARSTYGLPEDRFVFCSFNNSYKFNPQVFDLWCRLLRESDGSYLWLSQPAGSAQERLRREVQVRGVDPARLIFASRVESRVAHLTRLQLADLALDPFPYNSHSTGVDILWAGVPMVTVADARHGPEVAYVEHGRNGLVVPDAELLPALLQLLGDDAERERLGAGAMAAGGTYTIERMSERFCAGIEACLAAGRAQ